MKLSSDPMGICIGMGLAPNLFFICETTEKKSAPGLSILFTNANLGTRYLSACLQTVSLWG